MYAWLCSPVLALSVCCLPQDPSYSIGTWLWEVACFYPLCSPEGPMLLRRCLDTGDFLSYTFLYLSTSYLSYLSFRHSRMMQSIGGILCFLPCWPEFLFSLSSCALLQIQEIWHYDDTPISQWYYISFRHCYDFWCQTIGSPCPLALHLLILWISLCHLLLMAYHINILPCWHPTTTILLRMTCLPCLSF